MNLRGQGAIEYLLIIGAAVIIAVIVIALMMSLSGQGTGAVEEAGVSSIYQQLKQSGGFIELNGETYSSSDSIVDKLTMLLNFDEPGVDVVSGIIDPISGLVCTAKEDPKLGAGFNNVTLGEGINGSKAYVFDGQGDFLYCGRDGQFDVGKSDFTLNAWVKTTNVTSTQVVFGTGAPHDVLASNYAGYQLYMNHYGYLNWAVKPNNPDHPSGRNADDAYNWQARKINMGSVADGKWHMLTGVFVFDKGAYLYLDGVLLAKDESANQALGIGIDSSNPFLIGAYSWGYDHTANMGSYFNGTIDEVAMWDKALSANEIKKIYEGS